MAWNRSIRFETRRKTSYSVRCQGELPQRGFEHADNVSAAICGNFVVIKSYNPLEIVKLAAPEDMQICVAYPHFETPANKTEKPG